MKLHQVMGVGLALAAAGCAAPLETTDEAGEERIGAAESAIRLSDLESFPAYFGHDNRFSAGEDATWLYASFTSHAGKRVHIDVHPRPGAARAWVGFNLYSVRPSGHLSYTTSAQSWSGAAGLSLRSRGTGAYVVEMTSSRALADLELSLSCDGGSCSPEAQPGDLCGGIAGIACAEGLYCDYGADGACGAGDRSGTCAVQPQMCNKMYAPVCGCDGQTYGNACTAAAAGVSVAAEGECAPPVAKAGESCGGFRRGPSPVCAEGLYCSYRPEDTCGFADAPGTCAEPPAFCTEEYAPVCGCDQQTYANACVAAMRGASVLKSGACESEEQGQD